MALLQSREANLILKSERIHCKPTVTANTEPFVTMDVINSPYPFEFRISRNYCSLFRSHIHWNRSVPSTNLEKRAVRRVNRNRHTHGAKPSKLVSFNEKEEEEKTVIYVETMVMRNHNSNSNDEDTDSWTFPLSRMKGMTQERYNVLLAKAADRNRPQRCAAIISGFTCIGKTTFGTQWRPTYNHHRVINLEYNQYRQNSNSNGTGEVDHEAYLNDTLIAAKFIPGAIVVVNCHIQLRRDMHAHELDYVRVHPDFRQPAVKEAWRARAVRRETSGGAAAAQKFADRMMACWDTWSEMGTGSGFDCQSSPGFAFGPDDYLSTRVDKILAVARQHRRRPPRQVCTALISRVSRHWEILPVAHGHLPFGIQ